MLRAVAVDYGGVLVEDLSDRIPRIAQALGIPEERVVTALYGKNKSLWKRIKTGQISESERWANARRVLDVSDETLRWIEKEFLSIRVRTTLIDYLRTLKGALRLAIVSNAQPSYTDTWRTLGFGEIFDEMINSSEVGLAKPDPGIFALTLDRLGVAPSECAMLDDKEENVHAAESAGLRGIVYENEAQAIEAIETLRCRG